MGDEKEREGPTFTVAVRAAGGAGAEPRALAGLQGGLGGGGASTGAGLRAGKGGGERLRYSGGQKLAVLTLRGGRLIFVRCEGGREGGEEDRKNKGTTERERQRETQSEGPMDTLGTSLTGTN